VISRIGQALGDCNTLAETIDFTITAPVEAGDFLVVCILADVEGFEAWSPPDDGWTLHDVVGEDDHIGGIWTKVADGSEYLTILSWATAGVECAGVFVAYRGFICEPPLAENVTSRLLAVVAAGTDHDAGGVEGTQSTDRRIALWWIQSTGVTLTEAAGSGFTSFGQFTDTGIGKVTAGEHLILGPGASGVLTATTSGNADSVAAAWCLRVQPVVQPAGVGDAVPGTIGLVADPDPTASTTDEGGS
jgi:hypothetical protein